MKKLEELKAKLLARLTEDAGPAALFFSAGSDSLLLLNVLIEIEAKFSIVCLDHSFSREQQRQVDELVKKYDLRVFSYPPSRGYLIGDGSRVSLVEEYAFPNNLELPFVRDVSHNETRCAVDDVKLGPWHQGPAPIGFLLNIFGTRKTDRHYATGKAWGSEEWSKEGIGFYAPLWEWTRRDVREALRGYNERVPRLDTGALPMCLNCLRGEGEVSCPKTGTMIDSVSWQPQEMLQLFRAKHRLSGEKKALKALKTSHSNMSI